VKRQKSTTSQINACRSGAFPTLAEEDKDEALHMDTDETDEEVQDTGLAFDDDRVFMAMVHPVDPHHFICCSGY
jgi:hypothetical protein